MSVVSQRLMIATAAATVLTQYTEKHFNIKISADDVLDYFTTAAFLWHGIAPYAQRIFDHFFPPSPANPAGAQQ